MERLTQELWRELRRRGHVADLLRVPYAPYSRAGVVRGAMGWRLLDLAPREGGGFDVVIPTAFPSYFVRHPRKVTWLVAQYRQVYDLSGTEYAAAAWLRDATWRAAVREADSVSLGESAALFSISANVSRRLREHNGLEAVVLHPPPPVVRERSTTFGDAIVSIGRLDGLKRHDLLIDAMARTRTGARCVIIGTGVDEAALRRRIADLGLADRVTLAGWVDDDGLRRAYADARAVFYGPYDEDLGLVAMEALAAGKPVVTLRDSGGVLEFVEDGVNGWVTEPDPDGLAAAIDEVFTDAAGCAVRGAAGYERVASLSWDGVIDQLLAGA